VGSVIRAWRLSLASTVAMCLVGCTTQPYVVHSMVLPAEQFSSPSAPVVRVRRATDEEAAALADFPGREGFERSAKLDSAGTLVLAPLMVLFFFPNILETIIDPGDVRANEAQQLKSALAEFEQRLVSGIENRFEAAPPTQSPDVLELNYFSDYKVVGPAADKVCLQVHAWLNLMHEEQLLYRDILRFDSRVANDDSEQPECIQSPDDILRSADEIIPAMIQARLPGLPWKH